MQEDHGFVFERIPNYVEQITVLDFGTVGAESVDDCFVDVSPGDQREIEVCSNLSKMEQKPPPVKSEIPRLSFTPSFTSRACDLPMLPWRHLQSFSLPVSAILFL